MCACRPRKRTFANEAAAATVAGAATAGTPNAVDSWPVAMDSCVSTRTPGFTLRRNGCTMPAAPANASKRRSSSRPSAISEPHACPDRQLQLVVGLVASVERDPRGRDPGAHARFDLAAARREQVEPLVRGQPEHRVRGERLHGVERLRERALRRAEPGDQIRSIEHQQRRAVSPCERHGALPRDPQPVGPERRVRRPRVRDGGRGDIGLRSAGPDRLRPLSHRPDP